MVHTLQWPRYGGTRVPVHLSPLPVSVFYTAVAQVRWYQGTCGMLVRWGCCCLLLPRYQGTVVRGYLWPGGEVALHSVACSPGTRVRWYEGTCSFTAYFISNGYTFLNSPTLLQPSVTHKISTGRT